MSAVTPTEKFTARRGHLYDLDHRETTHLEDIDAFRAFSNVSGFAGGAYAIIDTASGDVLDRHAFRRDALIMQDTIERKRAGGCRCVYPTRCVCEPVGEATPWEELSQRGVAELNTRRERGVA